MRDRGTIDIGSRADLVLPVKDPLQHIKNTKTVRKEWIAGREVGSVGQASALNIYLIITRIGVTLADIYDCQFSNHFTLSLHLNSMPYAR